MKRSARKLCALILAGLLMALAGCAAQPGKPSDDPQQSLSSEIFTVDTKPEGPMLYPVMSKAVPDNPYNIPDYVPSSYVANSFKLVNEKWEDVTEYINGECEYVYVNGEVYGVQVNDYKAGKYILGLDGKPIEALKGYIWRNSWEQTASPPKDMMIVTTEKAMEDAAESDFGAWALAGVFNTSSGKLVIPAEYESMILLADAALGFKGGVMSMLDYEGNVLSSKGEGWGPSNEGYNEGDDLFWVNETTYIDLKGEIALTLEGVRGQTNFKGDYAVGIRGGPDEPWGVSVLIDRQGQPKTLGSEESIQRWGDYYVVDGKKVFDLSLQPVFTLTDEDENETVTDIIGELILVNKWNPETEQSTTTAYDKQTGEKKFSIEPSVWYENGFFTNWKGDEGTRAVYGMDGKPICENARVLKTAAGSKFIYIDDGKHMGYIDAQGSWVYRMSAAYMNLED